MVANYIMISLLLTLQVSVFAQQFPFQDTLLPDAERIDNLLSLMTLDEKIDYMASRQPGIPRLGIVKQKIMEGLHGVAYSGLANWAVKGDDALLTTIFPQAIGLAQTWDTDLVKRIAANSAYELRYIAQSRDFHRAGLILLAPVMDLGRDPRWGRLEECYGEDPFLASRLGVSFVEGLQGDHPRYWAAASLMKHFVGNNNENNRYTVSADFSESLFREYYSYTFYKAVTEGGANSAMMAYNKYNGVPCTVHPFINDVLKSEWNMQGIICTDGGGFRRLVDAHHYFENYTEAAAACIKAGINMFLDDYKPYLREALDTGLVSEQEIDEVLRGVLWTYLKLGLLDSSDSNPYASIGIADTTAPWNRESSKELALEAVQKSIVLLKNENQLLPLNKDKIKSVAVIGPQANVVLQDWYTGTPPYEVTILEGIKKQFGDDVEINYAATNKADSAVIAAQQSDLAIVCIGSHPVSYGLDWGENYVFSDGREEVDRQALSLEQEDLVKLVHKYNKNTVLVLVSSFPYTINWSVENIPAILHVTHSGQEMGNGLADVLVGSYNPSAKLALTWPKTITDLPPIADYDITNNRTYMYAEAEPLFPFGYGLSYTSFDYNNLTTDYSETEGLTVRCEITNTGEYDGDEVVQVYIKDSDARIKSPKIALKGFQKVSLEKGETKQVEIVIPTSELMNWNTDKNEFTLQMNEAEIYIGTSSADLLLNGKVTIQ